MINNSNIRNFSIIAHIDHGKSTLADRFIEICKNLKKNEIKNQMLDSMDIEREKGITIKAQCLTLNYNLNGISYILNLIDTPGHTDFSYEVSRSLEASEGAVLLIDITKGVQAQTLSNYYKALEKKLKLILVINKVDIIIPNSDKIKSNIANIFNKYDFLEISAKTGFGVKTLIEKIINEIPCPDGNKDNIFEAIIIDSWFDNYLGVTCIVKIKNGVVKKNDQVLTISNDRIYKIDKIGIFIPEKIYRDSLSSGEIGFVTIGCKNLNEIKVGDTITSYPNKLNKKIYQINKVQPKIFANIFPSSSEKFFNLKEGLAKLSLNDSSLEYTQQKSSIFGFGFKCGFLGLLHLDITKERLEREYDIKTIITPPNVVLKIIKDKTEKYISSPSEIIDIDKLEIQEPIVLLTILTDFKYIGKVTQLCEKKRGRQKDIVYDKEKVIIRYFIPMNEIIFNFFNDLQTLTNGLSSMDYAFDKYEKTDVVKLYILINDKKIDILEFIVYRNEAYQKGKDIIEKLKNIIPRQLFEIRIQASLEKRIIARTTIKALRKNVLDKCYGGDISRKKKLLKKQKIGKKKLKHLNDIKLPIELFSKIIDIKKE